MGKCRYTVIAETPAAAATSFTVVASYPRSANSRIACRWIRCRVSARWRSFRFMW